MQLGAPYFEVYTHPLKKREKNFYCPVCGRITKHLRGRIMGGKPAWLCVECRNCSKSLIKGESIYLDSTLAMAHRLAKKSLTKKRQVAV